MSLPSTPLCHIAAAARLLKSDLLQSRCLYRRSSVIPGTLGNHLQVLLRFGLERQVLSRFGRCRFAPSFKNETKREHVICMDKERNYIERAMLIYDGLHYHVLVVTSSFLKFLFICTNNGCVYIGYH